MLSWTVDAALQSGLFERVCVSTEDVEIASIAEQAGAQVLKRPDSLGSDSATVAEVCKYHLKTLSEKSELYDHLYCLYPTAPLRNANDLRSMASIFSSNSDAIAVVAVTNFIHYPHQALQITENSEIRPYWPQLVKMRGSQLPNLVAGNGSSYAVSIPPFMQNINFTPTIGTYAYCMSVMRSIDVDTQEEYDLLKAVFNLVNDKPDL